jgi:hypothetical protein
MRLINKKIQKGPLKVYDFTVNEQHHYILSDGIVSHNSYVPSNELSGGTGIKYCSDSIVMLSKSKDRDGTDIVGAIIKASMYKSRLSKENKVVELKLSYTSGLDRYYGLIELAEKYGVIEKVGNKFTFPDGNRYFRKEIEKSPETIWTKEMLDMLEDCANKEFSYGVVSEIEVPEIENMESE